MNDGNSTGESLADLYEKAEEGRMERAGTFLGQTSAKQATLPDEFELIHISVAPDAHVEGTIPQPKEIRNMFSEIFFKGTSEREALKAWLCEQGLGARNAISLFVQDPNDPTRGLEIFLNFKEIKLVPELVNEIPAGASLVYRQATH